MAADVNKKTLRHFYCRETFWRCFEHMSEDFDRGVDELVNEAMRVFAREKGYLTGELESRPVTTSKGLQLRPQMAQAHPQPQPPPPRYPPTPPPVPMQRYPVGAPPPPVPAMAPSSVSGYQAQAPVLSVIFQNQKYLIDKEQFIIGRGSKAADLSIPDVNISRQHVTVIRRNGAYYIKDLGSTNGIDYNGTRIDNKRIEEGDVFSLCDYQIRFTFR